MSFFPGGRGSDRVGDFSKYDADRLEDEAPELVNRANESSWYDAPGSAIDLAVARLCLLRRARSGEGFSASAGDDAVRRVLAAADAEAVIWLTSRVISYMDEQGFPDWVPGARLED